MVMCFPNSSVRQDIFLHCPFREKNDYYAFLAKIFFGFVQSFVLAALTHKHLDITVTYLLNYWQFDVLVFIFIYMSGLLRIAMHFKASYYYLQRYFLALWKITSYRWNTFVKCKLIPNVHDLTQHTTNKWISNDVSNKKEI